MPSSRREFFALTASAVAISALPSFAEAQSVAAAARTEHVVIPLRFNPAKLKGLSEKMLRSHHENNYGGAVKNLNKVEAELARVGKDTPGFTVSGLRQSQLAYTNSVILHEHYFANLGGDAKRSGPIEQALARGYGSASQWEESFRALGASLGGGSGWVILYFNLHTGGIEHYWSGNHTQALAFGAPLLVLDMYEHAYQIDYAAQAAKYVDAFFENANWDEVNARFERAQKAYKSLKG